MGANSGLNQPFGRRQKQQQQQQQQRQQKQKVQKGRSNCLI